MWKCAAYKRKIQKPCVAQSMYISSKVCFYSTVLERALNACRIVFSKRTKFPQVRARESIVLKSIQMKRLAHTQPDWMQFIRIYTHNVHCDGFLGGFGENKTSKPAGSKAAMIFCWKTTTNLSHWITVRLNTPSACNSSNSFTKTTCLMNAFVCDFLVYVFGTLTLAHGVSRCVCVRAAPHWRGINCLLVVAWLWLCPIVLSFSHFSRSHCRCCRCCCCCCCYRRRRRRRRCSRRCRRCACFPTVNSVGAL